MTRKTVEEPRCSNGIHCVAYPPLGEPSKLARGNPGSTCFACEEQRVSSDLKIAAAKSKAAERRKANQPHWSKDNGLEKRVSQEHAQAKRAREVLKRRRRSVLTCERGLRSAVASGDERLVRRWSRSLREAEARLAWAEADLARGEKEVWSGYAS